MKTPSGARAVQIVWSSRRGARNIEHIGSAHDDAELEALKAAARQRLAAGQLELDLGTAGPGPSAPLEIASSRMGHLLDALGRAYDTLGFPQATGHDLRGQPEGDRGCGPVVHPRDEDPRRPLPRPARSAAIR